MRYDTACFSCHNRAYAHSLCGRSDRHLRRSCSLCRALLTLTLALVLALSLLPPLSFTLALTLLPTLSLRRVVLLPLSLTLRRLILRLPRERRAKSLRAEREPARFFDHGLVDGLWGAGDFDYVL